MLNVQGMGNLCAKNYQQRTWLDRVIEKIKRVHFFLPHRVVYNIHVISVFIDHLQY